MLGQLFKYGLFALIGIKVAVGLLYRARWFNKSWAAEQRRVDSELDALRDRIWCEEYPRWSWRYIEGFFGVPLLMPIRVLGWVVCDWWEGLWRHEEKFPHYGLRIYEGMMGAGKTSGMQMQAYAWKIQYPKVKIVANYDCKFADHRMTSWRDFFDITNGEDGVIFLIDEISTMWDSMSYKDFPPELLQEVVQQRKERKVILGSAQHYMRILKALREQTFLVIRCQTLWGRLSIQTAYEGFEYERYHDAVYDPKTGRRGKLNRVWRQTFLLTNEIRNSYDTYAKVQMMRREGFVPRELQIRNMRGGS